MGVIEGRTWLEVLSPRECGALLASRRLGRVAFVAGDHPEVLPVNYVVDAGDIVFRTDPGTKLDAAMRAGPLAFEVDEADERARTGWSVLVVGRAEVVSDPGELARLRGLGLSSWAHGDKAHWVRLAAATTSGRRIHHA